MDNDCFKMCLLVDDFFIIKYRYIFVFFVGIYFVLFCFVYCVFKFGVIGFIRSVVLVSI